MKVEVTDIGLMLGAGTAVGVMLVSMLYGKERAEVRTAILKWCLQFGTLSLFLVSLIYLDIVNDVVRRGLSIFFVGLPAFSAGLLMLFYEKFLSKYEG